MPPHGFENSPLTPEPTNAGAIEPGRHPTAYHAAMSTALAVVAVIGFAAVVQTVTGFGFSLLAVPPLTLVIGPADAVAVALVLLVPANVLLTASEWRDVDRPAAARLLTGAVFGLPVGLALIRVASADALRVAVSVAVVVSIGVIVTGRPRVAGGPRTLIAAGFLTGALTTSITTNGPPTVLALQARGPTPSAFRPTVGAVLAAASAVGVGLFALDDRLGGQVPTAVAAGLPALAVGWSFGVALRRRVPIAWFRRAALGLLLVAAGAALVPAIR